MIKKCTKCNLEKDISNYKKHKGRRDGFYNQCRECVKEYRSRKEVKEQSLAQQRAWRNKEENKERTKGWAKKFRTSERGREYIKNDALKRSYGIGLDDYNSMFAKQNGRCTICEIHQSKLNKALSVDHDHKTGKVRSLLCHFCNTALGSLKEDINLLEKAINYLKIHKEF